MKFFSKNCYIFRVNIVVLFVFLQSSKCNSQQSCQETSVLENEVFEANGASPFIAPLSKGLPPKFFLFLEGQILSNATTFTIDLLAPQHMKFTETAPIALRFNPDFNEEDVTLNSFLRGEWGKEMNVEGLPLLRGENFRITFWCEEQQFKIYINEKPFASYQHRVRPEHISHVLIDGDAIGVKVSYPPTSVYCQIDPDLHTRVVTTKGAAPYVSQLDSKFSPGNAISVVGSLHSYADWLTVNLQSDGTNIKEIALQFMIRFEEGVVVLNTFEREKWGSEEKNNEIPLQEGDDFIITFHCEEDQFKICVNGEVFTTYQHRVDPRTVTKVYTNGELTLDNVFHHTKEPSTEAFYCESDSFSETCRSTDLNLVQQNLPTPTKGEYVADLRYGFLPGSVLIISGIIFSKARWFVIDLRYDNGTELIPLHFNPRFTQDRIVRNALINGGRGDEDSQGTMPLHKGEMFSIMITCEEEGFKICVNGRFFTYFKHQLDPDFINVVRVDGDISLNHMLYYTEKTDDIEDSCSSEYILQEHTLPTPKPGTYNTKLKYGLKKGSVISFIGSIQSNENWGVIDLISDASKFIALHFNLRFDENVVIRNTFENGVWDDEERDGGVPFQQGNNYNVTIGSHENGFKIYVDGKLFTTYQYRVNTDSIDMVSVRGAFGLVEVKYYTLEKCVE